MTARATDVLWWSCSWAAFGLVSGFVASRWSTARLSVDGPLTRIRPWERGGAIYDRLRIRRWKARLPDAGGWFAGSTGKRHVGGRDTASLQRFTVETRRAERVHWANAMWGFTFVVWTPLVIAGIMVCFGLVVHLPFVVVQRYNRARIERILDARARGVAS